jgi:50S ribosomal protein L16 3-hydroxylase
MIETTGTPEHFLGMPVDVFLRDFWQKKPLLIRQAFPGFVPPLSPEDLAGLACEEGPLSRLVTYRRKDDSWQLRTGPFTEDEFPELGHHDWTLLVQDMDKWDADVAELLQPFSFLPRWRIDDVMISFAVEGGSVGPHIDQYDVFLVQAMGRRNWQIEDKPRHEPAFRPDSELKLLQEFNKTHDWDLAPGDVLYLPPGYAHHGIARDSCMTFSVGMRAPSAAEMLVDFAEDLAQRLPEYQRYQDEDLVAAEDPFLIDVDAMQRVDAVLQQLQQASLSERQRWFGQFITRYRASGDIQAGPHHPAWRDALHRLGEGHALYRHPFARMAWSHEGQSALLFVSGESHDMSPADAKWICQHASIGSGDFHRLGKQAQETLATLYAQGYYQTGLEG